ncbi:NUAK family SNF1-like kinase 1 [Patiria miniata]|uniref:Protein kinase domain-containing protein n=1 Tax=Patiria miniata TaxID=46514 RepID=A0A913ZTN2_PATMI|nr:NUAK family SNF1-like kinase 1 [Patiria miniata]
MAGSDDSISSAASSGSDGEHSPCPASFASSASSSARSSSIKKMSRRREVGPASTIRHRHRHKLSHRFEFVRTLGSGTYGKVKLAVQLDTKEEVAIKCIPKSKIDNAADLRRLRQEIEVMSSLRHPHIIQVTEVFESRDKIIMVMEHAAGGELYDYINDGKVSATEAKRLFRQIVSAVHYLHKNNIVHRDLKLENVLLDADSTVKIADFGLSSTFGHNRLLDTFCGSPLYASPEIINGTPYHGPEVDCWSLGVILYAMVYRTMPFHGADFAQLKSQITGGDFFEPASTSDASDLIHRMLTVDPRKRITIDGILNDPWLRDRPLPGRKIPDICCQQEQEYRESGTGAVHSNVKTQGDRSLVDSLQATVKKPLTSILKKSLRRSSHRLGSSDSGLGSSTGRESYRRREEDRVSPAGEREDGGKPRVKKGILKKQGKDSGGDSGLGINESGQNKSSASLESSTERDRDGAKEKNKRDSGIDQDLSACCLLNEKPSQETCQLREPNRLKYVCKITRRHSRGKYSRVTKIWESIYTPAVASSSEIKAPPKTVDGDKDEATLEHNSSCSSNEDILGILDSPSLRTPTVAKKFQYSVEEVKASTTTDGEASSSTADQGDEENYTKDELMSAMDAELLEVYQKALRISQAVM